MKTIMLKKQDDYQVGEEERCQVLRFSSQTWFLEVKILYTNLKYFLTLKNMKQNPRYCTAQTQYHSMSDGPYMWTDKKAFCMSCPLIDFKPLGY